MADTTHISRRFEERVPWHPILDATEIEAGIWLLSMSTAHPIYAKVRLVRRGPDVGYRLDNAAGELVGYYVSLKSACVNAWRECGPK